jgi:uncharacterized protein (DUF1778 family)
MAKTKTVVKKQQRKAVRKEDSIRLRCTAEQKEILTEAATRAGLGVSGWLLSIGLREAQQPGARGR